MTGTDRLATLARVGLGAVRYRLTGRRAPLTAYVAVTNQCESVCGYCPSPFRAHRELGTAELRDLITSLADRGCQCLVLTGGEPLLRRDLPELVAHAAAAGLWVRLETSGSRYPDLADRLPGVKHLVVSIDGSEAVHDAQREPGSYQAALHALDVAARREVHRSTVTVLTRHNLDDVEAIVTLAQQRDHLATFRLLDRHPDVDAAITADLEPDPADLRRALRVLLEARRLGRPIGMTQKTLRTLLAWADFQHPTAAEPREDQQCVAGQTHVFVDVDGTVYPCRQLAGTDGHFTLRDGFGAAFDAMPCPSCQACVVADLTEQNHLHALNVPALLGGAENWRRERARRASTEPTEPG